jgi:hypothetical protein
VKTSVRLCGKQQHQQPAAMNTVKILAIFAEDKQGQLNNVTKIIAGAGINIRLVTIADSNISDTQAGRFGVMKFLVDDPVKARDILRQNHFLANFIEALAVEIPDRPGALLAITDCLAQNKINLTSVSGFVANNRAILLIETDNLPSARAALESAQIRLLPRDELLKI